MCIRDRYGRQTDNSDFPISINGGIITGLSITGNSFSGFRDNFHNPRYFINVDGAATINSMNITGNGFSHCRSRAINFEAGSVPQNCTVVGNTFYDINGGGNAFPAECAEAANIINNP